MARHDPGRVARRDPDATVSFPTTAKRRATATLGASIVAAGGLACIGVTFLDETTPVWAMIVLGAVGLLLLAGPAIVLLRVYRTVTLDADGIGIETQIGTTRIAWEDVESVATWTDLDPAVHGGGLAALLIVPYLRAIPQALGWADPAEETVASEPYSGRAVEREGRRVLAALFQAGRRTVVFREDFDWRFYDTLRHRAAAKGVPVSP